MPMRFLYLISLIYLKAYSDFVNFPNIFGRKQLKDDPNKTPFRIVNEFVPYRLYANKKGSVTLVVKLTNITSDPLMSSITVQLPKQMSFGGIGLEKAKEIRLGDVAPNEQKESRIDVYGDVGTDRGQYTIILTAYAHYRDYDTVLNSVTKSIALDVA